MAASMLLCAVAFGAPPPAYELNINGLELFDSNRFDEAAAVFEKALQLDPSSHSLRVNLASTWHKLAAQTADNGDFLQATDFERRAFTLNSSNSAIRATLSIFCNNLALRQADSNDFSSAKSLLAEAIRLQPANKSMVTNMCRIVLRESIALEKAGEDDKALALRKEAFGLDSSYFESCALLGDIYYKKNDYSNAVESWSKALLLQPDTPGLSNRIDHVRRELTLDKSFSGKDRAHFLIQYETATNEALSWKVSKILDDAYREVGQKLECWPKSQLTVMICSKDQFKATTSAPEWTIGRFDGKIRISVTDIEGNDESLKQVICHEYTHALVNNVYGANVPLWINEGLAQVVSSGGTLTADDKTFMREAGMKSLVPPWETDPLFASDKLGTIRLAYLESRLFTKYLFDRHGNYVTRQFFEAIAKGASPEQALLNMFNMTGAQINNAWIEYLNAQVQEP